MAHTHQAKRPYNGPQPSIPSYFPSKTTTSSSSIPHIHNEHRSPSPALPPPVQANLLSVGMRVRKSVPEGYKTGTQYSAFGLFSPAPPASQHRPAPVTKKDAGGRPRARELTPFCGILKVGGLALQQWGIYDSSGVGGGHTYDEEEEDEEDDDDVPVLSSQGSTLSASSVDTLGFGGPGSGGANKRRFFDDEDGGNPQEALAWAGNVRFGTGLGEHPFNSTSTRVIAVPRRKRVNSLGLRKTAGQGNGCGEADFEDAEFLDYGLGTAGMEVEMGGV